MSVAAGLAQAGARQGRPDGGLHAAADGGGRPTDGDVGGQGLGVDLAGSLSSLLSPCADMSRFNLISQNSTLSTTAQETPGTSILHARRHRAHHRHTKEMEDPVHRLSPPPDRAPRHHHPDHQTRPLQNRLVTPHMNNALRRRIRREGEVDCRLFKCVIF